MAAVTALSAITLAAPPAHAGEAAVPCDPAALVEAVADANASTAADTLSLAPDCVYTLTTAADPTWHHGLPEISGRLTINGNHATIRRAEDAPQFRLISNRGELTLNDLTLTGGHAPDGTGVNSWGDANPGDSGGGIRNWRQLTITNSVITGNSAGAGAPGPDATTRPGGLGGSGGGIASYGNGTATLTMSGTSVTGNTSGAGGRGGSGTGTLRGASGGGGGFGGGIALIGGTTLRLTDSSITGNSAGPGGRGGSGGADGGSGGYGGSGGIGGGLFTSGDPELPLNPVIGGSTITGNQAGRGGDAGAEGPGGNPGYGGYGGSGGGLSVFHDNLTLDGGTVHDNSAGEAGAGPLSWPGSGGGIDTLDARVTLLNGATVTGNRPDNCAPVAAVPGCVNDLRAVVTPARNQLDDLAVAKRALSR